MRKLILLALLMLAMSLMVACRQDRETHAPRTVDDNMALANDANTIEIAAFNIQIFGPTKRSKPDVMNILTRIAREFDVMLVQEIRDKSEQTIPYYLQKINEMPGPDYAYVRSERVGTDRHKEAYAYVYNTERVDLIQDSAYMYDDSGNHFVREPYIASFRSGNFDFTLAGIHVDPDEATSEIGHLATVYDTVIAQNPDEKDIIIMGDFNADGSYHDEDDTSGPLRAARFRWVVTNDMDTTVAAGSNTYDRMVMTDATYSHEYMDGSASVLRFDSENGYAPLTVEAKEVSDHSLSHIRRIQDRLDGR